jgi:hypothetical protein
MSACRAIAHLGPGTATGDRDPYFSPRRRVGRPDEGGAHKPENRYMSGGEAVAMSGVDPETLEFTESIRLEMATHRSG